MAASSLMLRLAALAAALAWPAAAWAQVAEAAATASKAADSLLDKGVLGTVSVIGLLATAALAWSYNALWSARLADAKAAAADLRAANKEMSEALNASAKTSAALTVAVESQGREFERRHADLKEDLNAIQDVRTVVVSNASAMARIEADVRMPTRGQR